MSSPPPATPETRELQATIARLTQANADLQAANRRLADANAALTREVEERERAAHTLRESDALFRMLIENVQSAVALIDQRGAFRVVNAAFLQMFDLAPDADILNINNRDWAQWQVFDEHGVLLDVDEHPVRRAMRTRMRVQNQLVGVRSPLRSEPRWLLISAAPLLDVQGHIHRLVCTYHEITGQKEAEAALRASEARLSDSNAWLHAILDQATEEIIVRDAAGRVVLANAAVRRYARTDLAGTGLKQIPEALGAPLDRAGRPIPRAQWPIVRALGGQGIASGEVWRPTPDGDARVLLVTASPIFGGAGQLLGAVSISTDITELTHREEELREALAAKEDALATNLTLLREVHHRVKNNLQMLCDLMYLQMEAMPNSEQHQSLQDAYGRVYAIARLHEQLYQSLESGRVRLGEYLGQLIAGFGSLYPRVRVRLDAEGEALALDLDRAIHVGLMVNELVTNAMKHAFPTGAPSGEVVVALRTLGEQVELQVRDNGCGLPADLDLAQAKSLGLRIVRILAKRVRAIVKVENHTGARFTIVFPLHADDLVEPEA